MPARLTEYVARCGRADCPVCQGANGTNGRSWPGRLCQYGAKVLAEQGKTWRQILAHYYGAVTFSDGQVSPPAAPTEDPTPPQAGGDMKLSDYPVPDGNNTVGWHWLPQLADARPEAATRAQLKEMWAGGARWLKLITSPGGDRAWTRGSDRTGAAEMTFCLALDMGFGVVVRIFNDAHPPYLTPAVQANLRHLQDLAAGQVFYVEPANEIDAEWKGPITRAEAEGIVRGIADFIDWCWAVAPGKIIPVFPSFGYGGPGYNWFQVMHDIGKGDRLDRCGVAVHNYASANRLMEPFDPDYIAGTPVSEQVFEAMPWRWAGRRIGDVNAKRRDNAAKRALLTTDDQLMAAYSSGWYTYRWALKQLNDLGHTETPLLLTETGTRVGEMVEWEPRIDPLLHCERTRAMIESARVEPRILMTAFWHWIGKAFAPTGYEWEDQAAHSPIWDRRWNATMPAGEYAQIVTPGRLPIIDDLEANPVPPGRPGTVTQPPAHEEEEPVPEPTRTPIPDDVLAKYGLAIVPPASDAPYTKYLKVVRLERLPGAENRGNHNWYFDVLNERGERDTNATVTIRNAGNNELYTVRIGDKPTGEMVDKPIGRDDTLDAWPAFTSVGYPAESVTGVHARHADEPPGNTLGHFSFRTVWQVATKPVIPPVTPPAEELSGCANLIVRVAEAIIGALKK